ncbi:type II toxin-antitoxin system RelE/ParE family toxin [Acetivibrio saccincola]|uniref:Uncharacterized protein n=1 Tax=Acetivibrio saccincola TaxID=1677857 RepID=A0A2K9EF87_9FIRM|nr:type II toxin-antitoxin system YoeB family toxin [Acetivibrio saccincola]AUG56563.1 hypothetical protein HVS_03065 [Acetivibrio saccincola]NLI57647.1 type II toxin-antitoxin system YoeB family toxin [Clostridium sp.]HOA80093.1 type II toxin-antitoxin system YoeB family toxin [Defluviitaleaceae bacterium]
MLFEYENDSVKEIFTNFELMKKKIGYEKTKTIKKRLDQLKASPNYSIYLMTGLGKPHPLTGNLKGYYGISITGNVRLVIKPDSINLEPEELKKCETVIIKGVVDYHGGKINWFIS